MHVVIRLLSAALLCLLTIGAASAAKKVVQVPAQLAGTHGYVYVSFPKWSPGRVTVQPVTGGEEQSLDVRQDGVGKLGQGLWLPPGEYRVSWWGPYPWSDYPPFTVEAGRVTDLGNLVLVNVGGYELVMAPLRDSEHTGDVDVVLDEYAPYLKSSEPLRWEPSGLPEPVKLAQPPTGLGLIAELLMAHDRKVNKPSTIEQLKAAASSEELLRLTRTVTAPMYEDAAADPAGNLYFGADFGAIRIRRPDSTWSGVGVDTLRTISAVAWVGDALFAGSDDGVLSRSDDHGSTWTVLTRFARDEAIIGIDYAAGHWLIATARQVALANGTNGADNVIVHAATRDDLGDLEKLREFPIEVKKAVGWFGARPQVFDGAYYINHFFGLQRLDLASMQWRDITPPATVSSHRVDATTGTLSAFSVRGAKVFVSEDKGATWRRVGRPPSAIADVQFDAPDQGVANRWNPSAFSGTWEIYSYAASTDTWAKVAEAPPLCKPLRVSAAAPLLCIANDASIFRRDGTEWVVEFSAR